MSRAIAPFLAPVAVWSTLLLKVVSSAEENGLPHFKDSYLNVKCAIVIFFPKGRLLTMFCV